MTNMYIIRQVNHVVISAFPNSIHKCTQMCSHLCMEKCSRPQLYKCTCMHVKLESSLCARLHLCMHLKLESSMWTRILVTVI